MPASRYSELLPYLPVIKGKRRPHMSLLSLAHRGLQNPQFLAKYDMQGLLQLPMGNLMSWQGQHSCQKASLSC